MKFFIATAFKTALAALLGATTLLAAAPARADDALKAAIAAPTRTPTNVARDVWRHPYETLSFFGIKPDMTVVELVPGGGWYTEILAPYLRDKGSYTVGTTDPTSDNPNAQASVKRFRAFLDAKPQAYDKVNWGVLAAGAGKFDYGKPASADLVLTFRNLHNFMQLGEPKMKAVLQSAFDALKPGGVFGVVEHRLPAAKVQDEKASTGYMHEAYVIKVIESVGFKLAAKSEINANPKDHANHENGVWALPPVLTNGDKDKAKYLAIGESDRMTLKFVKP